VRRLSVAVGVAGIRVADGSVIGVGILVEGEVVADRDAVRLREAGDVDERREEDPGGGLGVGVSRRRSVRTETEREPRDGPARTARARPICRRRSSVVTLLDSSATGAGSECGGGGGEGSGTSPTVLLLDVARRDRRDRALPR
jgi:hypothetical protein